MTRIIELFLLFNGYHGLNIFLAWQNKQIVARRINHKKMRQIEHLLWFVGYCILCAPQYWIVNSWFVVAILIPHFSVFGPAYNHYRGFDSFQISLTSESITEKIMVWLKMKDMEVACFVAEFIAVIFFILSIIFL